MPTSKLTGVIVSHIWDDDSKTDIEIKIQDFDDTGPCVSVCDGSDTVYIRPESWDEIKEQIDGMMGSINE